MGLFSNDYESAGPGIAKNAPRKKGLALFFDLFFRKLWKLFGLNMLFFIFVIPLIGILPAAYYIKDSRIALAVIGLLLLVFAVNLGPALAGLSKVMRMSSAG